MEMGEIWEWGQSEDSSATARIMICGCMEKMGRGSYLFEVHVHTCVCVCVQTHVMPLLKFFNLWSSWWYCSALSVCFPRCVTAATSLGKPHRLCIQECTREQIRTNEEVEEW